LSCLRGKLARAVLRGGGGGNTASLLDYDWRAHKVTDIRDGVFYTTRFASPQGSLVPLTPQESLVLYRSQPRARQAQLPVLAQQLWLFELVKPA